MVTVPVISTSPRWQDYTPSVSTTDFAVTWPVIGATNAEGAADLYVWVEDTGELTTDDFSFTGTAITGLTGMFNGGTVTLDTAVSGKRVVIASARLPRRTSNFLEGKSAPMTTFDIALDDIAVQMADLQSKINRALRFPLSDDIDGEVPEASERALSVLGFGADGSPMLLTADPLTAPVDADDISFLHSAAGAQARSVAQVLSAERVSIEDFAGADPSGSTYSDAALTAALAAADHVIIPPGKQFKIGNGASFQVTGNNKIIECWGTGKLIVATGRVGLDVYGSNFEGRNLNMTGLTGGAGATTGVQLRDGGFINGGRFDGDFIYPIGFASDNGRAQRFTIDGTDAAHMNAAILANSCDDIDIYDFLIDNYQGYGIRYINEDLSGVSEGWRITNGRIHGRRETLTATATGGQTTFDFTTTRQCVRFGVQINRIPISVDNYTLTNTSGNTWRLVVSPCTADDRVDLLCNASLEGVNLSSLVTGGRLSNVLSEEAGDSGFVICDDQSTGAAWRIEFSGCEARFPLNAGFAEVVTGTRHNSYQDCVVRNAGMAKLSALDGGTSYSSGFLLSGYAGRVKGGKVISNWFEPTMLFGIVMNNSMTPDTLDGVAWDIDPLLFVGDFESGRIRATQSAAASSDPLQLGIRLSGQPLHLYGALDLAAAWVGKPADTTLFTYAAAATGWTRQTAGAFNGTAMIRTIQNDSVTITPLAYGIMDDAIAEISWLEKAVSYTSDNLASYVKVTVDMNGGGTILPHETYYASNTSEKVRRTMIVTLKGATKLKSIEIGSPSGGDLADYDDFKIEYRPYV